VTKLDFALGDLIEWVFLCDNAPVGKDNELWSSIEKRYVPICSEMIHVCVKRDNETYTWLNNVGTFQAKISDHQAAFYHHYRNTVYQWIVPRTCK